MHRSTRPARRHSLARRIVVTLASFVAFAGIGAMASWIVTAPITGGGSVAKVAPVWTQANVTSGSAICTATVAAGGKMNLQVTAIHPGSSCVVTGTVSLPTDSTNDAKVQGISLTLPAGVTATFDSGSSLKAGSVLAKGSQGTVAFDVAAADTAVMDGSSTTFGPSDGLVLAPQ